MGNMADYNINEVAGACSLMLGSLGGLLLICFKSRCSNIGYSCLWGMFKWNCQRRVTSGVDTSDDENEAANRATTTAREPPPIP